MYQVDLHTLHQLWEQGQSAIRYAKEHYGQLAGRKHAYTLYSPHTYDIGVTIPSSFIPEKARVIQTTTRRKDYLAYELDESYGVLRTITVLDHSNIDCIHHHFQLDGYCYACPFHADPKIPYRDEVSVLKYEDGKPVYFANVTRPLLFAQFYEYTSNGKMMVSTYRYWPNAEYTQYGYSVDRDAPMDSLNSPIARYCREEVPHIVDFKKWVEGVY